MRKLLSLAIALASLSTICSAQTITETFGIGANAFTMDFVTIGNPNNVADTTGGPNPAGSVAYAYNLGKYEVSRGMIDKANAAGSLGITMWDMTSFGGNGINRPATEISWSEAARFVNYLNTSSGSTAAYKFDGSGNFQLWSSSEAGYNSINQFRNSLAKFFLPSTDEWYKAAYGSPNGSWYNYPTGSDNAPTAVAGGTAANTAVYNGQTGPADINNAGGLSPYGTMGQGGNVVELTESAFDGINDLATDLRELRGGSWFFSAADMNSLDRESYLAISSTSLYIGLQGFRVASVPEPSALSLLAAGLGGLALLRLRRS